MGLMPFKGQAPEGAPPEAEADTSRTIPEGESNASPEEQAQYDAFVKNALTLIYDGKQVRPEVLEALKAPPEGGGEAPAEAPEEVRPEDVPDGAQPPADKPNPAVYALANAAVSIVSKLDDSAKQANQPVSDDVLMHGGIAVIEELAEVAEAAKIYDYSEDEMSGALTVAMDMYRPKAIQDGRTTEDTLKGQFGDVVKADQEGRLNEVVPGADQAADAGRKLEQQEEE